MYNGNCALKLDACPNAAKSKIEIQSQVISMWLTKNQSRPVSNGATDPVVMACMSPYG